MESDPADIQSRIIGRRDRNPDLSIDRSLGATFAFVAVSLSVIVITGFVLSRILSAARAYVGGEGLWSKAEKDGVVHLLLYGETRDENEYRRFRECLVVSLGDRKAREELERPAPRIAVARQGFREGRNHENDIDAMIWLFRRFRGVGYFNRAVAIWEEGDRGIDRLQQVAADVHERALAGKLPAEEWNRQRERISAINAQLTTLEDSFSFALGEEARWARRTLLLGMAVAAGLLIFVTGAVSRRAARLLRREARDLRESEERYRALTEAATDSIVSIDERGTVLYANRATEKIFGHPVDRITGNNLTMLMPETHRNRHDAGLARYRATGTRRLNWESVEMPGLHATGGEIPLELSFGEVVTGGKVTFTGIIRDVSERKAAERVQSALYRIAEITHSAGDLPEFYAALHRIVGELMQAKNFYIALADEAAGEIRFPYFVDEVDPPPAPLPLGRGLTGHIIRTGQPLLLSEDEIQKMTADGIVEAYGANVVDWLGVPLRTGEKTFGVITVQSYTERVRYGQAEKDLLTFVSQHIATAIDKKRAAEESRRAKQEIERLAFQDPLTGLANRYRLDDHLAIAVGNARREKHPLAVLFIDLDHLKQVNDSLGHKIGDLLLQEIASRIRLQIRGTDTVARLGGDEFILLLAKIGSREGAEYVARKLQQSFREPFIVAGNELSVTFSMGISLFPQDGEDGDTLIRNADAAMYAAKQQGRDNFRFHSGNEAAGSRRT